MVELVRRRRRSTLVATLLAVIGLSAAVPAALGAQPVVIAPAAHHDVSPPLRSIPPALPLLGDHAHPALAVPRPVTVAPNAGVLAPHQQVASPLAPATLLNFGGVGNGFSGPQGTFTVASAPPDTNGDVGPNHYVEIVNTDFAIFNKSGTALYGPVPINTLWSGFGGGCQTNNDGDATVPTTGSPTAG